MSEIHFNDFTPEQKVKHISRMFEAEERGDFEEANRLQLQIPISVAGFEAVKSLFGSSFVQSLVDDGHDFSLVEAKYGKNYLD